MAAPVKDPAILLCGPADIIGRFSAPFLHAGGVIEINIGKKPSPGRRILRGDSLPEILKILRSPYLIKTVLGQGQL